MFLFASNASQTNVTLVVVHLVGVVVDVVELSCVHHLRGFMDFFSSTSALRFLFNDFSLLYSAKIKIELP